MGAVPGNRSAACRTGVGLEAASKMSACGTRGGSGDRPDVGKHAAGVPGWEGSYQRRGAVELDAALAGGLGPGELAGVPFDEGFGVRRERSDYEAKLSTARRRIGKRDPDDVDVLAVALTLNLPVWSNDNDFEDAGVEWYSIAELLKTLGIESTCRDSGICTAAAGNTRGRRLSSVPPWQSAGSSSVRQGTRRRTSRRVEQDDVAATDSQASRLSPLPFRAIELGRCDPARRLGRPAGRAARGVRLLRAGPPRRGATWESESSANCRSSRSASSLPL
jgi:hypothetical protein